MIRGFGSIVARNDKTAVKRLNVLPVPVGDSSTASCLLVNVERTLFHQVLTTEKEKAKLTPSG